MTAQEATYTNIINLALLHKEKAQVDYGLDTLLCAYRWYINSKLEFFNKLKID